MTLEELIIDINNKMIDHFDGTGLKIFRNSNIEFPLMPTDMTWWKHLGVETVDDFHEPYKWIHDGFETFSKQTKRYLIIYFMNRIEMETMVHDDDVESVYMGVFNDGNIKFNRGEKK